MAQIPLCEPDYSEILEEYYAAGYAEIETTEDADRWFFKVTFNYHQNKGRVIFEGESYSDAAKATISFLSAITPIKYLFVENHSKQR